MSEAYYSWTYLNRLCRFFLIMMTWERLSYWVIFWSYLVLTQGIFLLIYIHTSHIHILAWMLPFYKQHRRVLSVKRIHSKHSMWTWNRPPYIGSDKSSIGALILQLTVLFAKNGPHWMASLQHLTEDCLTWFVTGIHSIQK